MPTPQFGNLGSNPTTQDIVDYVHKLRKELNYLLTTLDTQNVNRLDAKVIVANTITAEKMNVTQLSAISADLGSITAGTVTGATVRTGAAGANRIEMSLNKFRGIDSASSLAGLFFEVLGTGLADVKIFHSGNEMLVFQDDISWYTIKPGANSSYMSLGVAGKTVLADGTWVFDKIDWTSVGTITATSPSGNTGEMIWGTSSQGTGPHIWKNGQWYALSSVPVT